MNKYSTKYLPTELLGCLLSQVGVRDPAPSIGGDIIVEQALFHPPVEHDIPDSSHMGKSGVAMGHSKPQQGVSYSTLVQILTGESSWCNFRPNPLSCACL